MHPIDAAMLFWVRSSVAMVRSEVFWKLMTRPVARAKSCRVFLRIVVAATLAAAIISVSSAYCRVTGGSFERRGWHSSFCLKACAISL